MAGFVKKMPEVGAGAVDIVAHICQRHQIEKVNLLCHAVSSNWRQRFATTRQRLDSLDECFAYKSIERIPISLSTREVSEMGVDGLTSMCEEVLSGGVVSMTSLVKSGLAHIPMMNLHPNDGVLLDDIVSFIKRAYPGMSGYLLSSGRHFHYYGDFLIDENGWRELFGNFLIAYDFVHPGYCGFRMFDGFSTLRLTAHSTYKPHVPKLVAVI